MQDDLMSLGKASRCAELCVDGRGVHPATIARWATRGVRGVRLQTTRLGGRRLVTIAAIRDFLDQLNGTNSTLPSPGDVSRRQLAAKAKLDAANLR